MPILFSWAAVQAFGHIECDHQWAPPAVADKLQNRPKRDGLAGVRPYQKITELLTMTPDDVIAALAMVTAMLMRMRLLYGAWPWESRKTWYRTKPVVPGADTNK